MDWILNPIALRYKTYIVELLLRQKPLPPPTDGRHVPLKVGHDVPLVDERRGHPYISNSIRSSRYTPWNFLPRQILFQCTRLANFYFICIGIPQAIPGFSTTGSYTTILPVGFFLMLTIAKEGIDDLRRHRLDKVENNALATVLRPKHENERRSGTRAMFSNGSKFLRNVISRGRKQRPVDGHEAAYIDDEDIDKDFRWTRTKWHDIHVGDVLKLRRDEPVPTDIVLLSATGAEGIAYVETMALDGETNLKSKQAQQALRGYTTIEGIKTANAYFVLEDPNRNLYDFSGRVTVDDQTYPLTLNDIILRGCVLRNTTTAIGMVINTGEECKIRMNANHHPKAKKPRLERYTNEVVITLIIYVIVLSVGCSGGYLIWHHNFERHAWYLNNAYVPFKEIIIGYIIMFNNVIPLALYVTLEIIKVGQMLMIAGDIGMFDEETNKRMTCNTNTILENLGQVSYLLSDKTGTLTENIMRFRGLSVGGTAWYHLPKDAFRSTSRKSTTVSRKSVERPKTSDRESYDGRIVVEEMELSPMTEASASRQCSVADGSSVHTRAMAAMLSSSGPRAPIHSASQLPSFVEGTTAELLLLIRRHSESLFARRTIDFILAMALCHTALPERTEDGNLDFQASSPDELALVRAAQDLGMVVVNRSTGSITLATTDNNGEQVQQVYEVLDVIEFSSKRKRMSIIVRRPDGGIWLICKGADSAILPRLKQAGLAARASAEVRRSIQLEREQRRQSQQSTPRNSFGGRPSLTIERQASVDARQAGPSNTLEVPGRRSFVIQRSSSFDNRPVVMSNSLDVPRNGLASSRPSLGSRRSTDRRSTGRETFASMNARVVHDDHQVFSRCFKDMDDFATSGLRTLVFAQRMISETEYVGWKQAYREATTSLSDRQNRIEAVGELIENGFYLLGASAIEDKLQKGVPETIDKLRQANIKIWMLTGDKRETALNIARAAKLCLDDSDVHVIDSKQGDLKSRLQELAEDIQSSSHNLGVIDGQTLSHIEADPILTNMFFSLVPVIDSVICCRASPAQKAAIVKGIRARMPGLTMAIGDGANDISMITASHVGVGISGKEGLQAARVADFSIAQFRFLQRLLLVHGRWNYVRTAKFILWTYWKEMFFYMVQASYQHYDGYTGSSLYESWSLTALNTLFTSLCVILPGVFEQDLSAETLLAIPELYVHGQRNKELNLRRYIKWMALAAAQGLLVFYITYALYGKHSLMSDNGTFAIGDICFSLAIYWTNIKLLVIETHNKTKIVGIGFLIVMAGWWAWNAFLSAAYIDNISPFDVKNDFSHGFGRDPAWWLTFIVALAVLFAMEMVWKTIYLSYVVAGRWPPWKKQVSKQNPEEVDLEVWQELQKDAAFQQKLKSLADERRNDGLDYDDREADHDLALHVE